MTKRELVARVLCKEHCAVFGEPPCWKVSDEWPNKNCLEPNCHALADAVIEALKEPSS